MCKSALVDTSVLAGVIRERLEVIDRSAESVSREALGVADGIKRIFQGHKPSFDRACKLLLEMGLTLDVLEAKPLPPPSKSPTNPPPVGDASAFAPVSDVRLARMLALLADEWEASDERARSQLERRFQLHFAELEGGGGPVRRLVGWLGWRVIEGRAGELEG